MREDPFHRLVTDYEICLELGIPIQGKLHEESPVVISEAIATVVNVEGPIHFDEVVKRIRDLWGLKRAGQRMKRVIERGVSYGVTNGLIKRDNDFLWPMDLITPSVRCRSSDYPAKIELICSEEIEEAILLVLRHQFDTRPNELAVQASRLLGFRVTREMTSKVILQVVDQMIENGRLKELPNGMIHLLD